MRWLPLAMFARLAVLLAAGVLLELAEPDRDALPSPLDRQAGPGFSLPVLHEPGRLVSLADLKGAAFVLNVWGSWCPSWPRRTCGDHALRREPSACASSVTTGRTIAADGPAPGWSSSESVTGVVVADQDGALCAGLRGIYGAPETFLVDANGVIRWKHVGDVTDGIIHDQLLPALAQSEAGPMKPWLLALVLVLATATCVVPDQ
jgi:cytochrome c biogenesis protein CcmG/thiol:disulfide interchange protein DsbE